MKRYFSFFFKFLEFAAHDHFNGKKEGKRETAFNMKNKGYSDATIADILDVGINVIQQWFHHMEFLFL